MSFAVRNDGVYRCRSIGGPEELLPDEVFSAVYVPLLSVGVDIDAERSWRDGELASLMWLRERHRDQMEIAVDTTLTGEQFTELLLYMQALRDWPQSPDFPNSEHRPLAPAWIADQTE
ncbi:phage tail assembly chaperone [Pseudomonas hormoni]